MDLNELGILKELSKDKSSFNDLKKIVGNIIEEREQKARRLALLEAVVDSNSDGILITRAGIDKPNAEIVYANAKFCGITGYSEEELIGESPDILNGPKTDREVQNRLNKRLGDGVSSYGKTVNYRKDGSEFITQWDIHPLTDRSGNITHWVSYHHTVPERSNNGQVPNESLEFDKLHEESQRTVAEIDLDGNFVKANKAFRELTGYSNEELTQVKVWDLFPQKHMKPLKDRFDNNDAAAFFGGQQFKGIIKHESGMLIQVKGKTKLLARKDKKIIRAEIESLSLQKRVMKTLKKHLNVRLS